MLGTEGQRDPLKNLWVNETWVTRTFNLTPQGGDIQLCSELHCTEFIWLLPLHIQGWKPSLRGMDLPNQMRWTSTNRSWRESMQNSAQVQASKEIKWPNWATIVILLCLNSYCSILVIICVNFFNHRCGLYPSPHPSKQLQVFVVCSNSFILARLSYLRCKRFKVQYQVEK